MAEGTRERYQFTWPGKRAAKAEARKPINKTLRPVPERSKNWDDTQNLYIEGDNLDALKILRETYAGKIKMIYIDPPYNTGHDFIYKDDFGKTIAEDKIESGDYDEEGGQLVSNPGTNGRFHSDWCSMIYPRLLLARDLLASDGAIFISIDDNEIVNLRKTCDDIFGSTNFLAQIVTISNPGGRDYGDIAVTHEYILCYQKNDAEILQLPVDRTFPCADSRGGFNPRELRNRNPKFTRMNRPNLYYPFYADPDATDKYGYCSVSLEADSTHCVEIYPLNAELKESCWRWGKSKVQSAIDSIPDKSDIVAKQVASGKWNVYEKSRLSTAKAKSVWTETSMRTEDGTRLTNSMFPSAPGIFDHPKPIDLVLRCLRLTTRSDDIVLDFFSGSATTAHAVMQLNAEDGGNRKFILVQLPEKTAENSEARKAGYSTICELGEERIRRAGEKIKAEVEESNSQPELVASPKRVPDIGFRVLRVDSSNYEDKHRAVGEYTQDSLDLDVDNTKDGRSDLDLLFEALPSFQLEYSSPIETLQDGVFRDHTVYSVNGGQLLACFEPDIPEELIRAMTACDPRPSYAVVAERSLPDSAARTNFEEIFKQSADGVTGRTKIRII